jgi:hypothetical protein
MNETERQYRASLRWYSKNWRRSHSEALLDTLLELAEAEGRIRPTRSEKLDLARRGITDRLIAATPFAFFTLALLAMVVLLSVTGVDSGASLMLHLPILVAPGAGSSSAPISSPVMTAGWVQLVSVSAFPICTAAGVTLLRRVRRSRKPLAHGPAHDE